MVFLVATSASAAPCRTDQIGVGSELVQLCWRAGIVEDLHVRAQTSSVFRRLGKLYLSRAVGAERLSTTERAPAVSRTTLAIAYRDGIRWTLGVTDNTVTATVEGDRATSLYVNLETPLEVGSYFEAKTGTYYGRSYGSQHLTKDVPFSVFYASSGIVRPIEYFLRRGEVARGVAKLFDDRDFPFNLETELPRKQPGGANRLFAVGTDDFAVDFSMPSSTFSARVDRSTASLTLLSPHKTSTLRFSVVPRASEENVEINDGGDRLPRFSVTPDPTITNTAGTAYGTSELLTRLYRHSAFSYKGVGMNVAWNWAAQYTSFVDNSFALQVKNNVATWGQAVAFPRPGAYDRPLSDPSGLGKIDLDGYMHSYGASIGWPLTFSDTTLDRRHINTNALFIQAAWTYYAWTGDRPFLDKLWTKLKKAMDYQLRTLVRGDEWVINACGDGQGLSHRGTHCSTVGCKTLFSNYWDLLPFGGKDAWATIDFYNSLLAMSQVRATFGDTAGAQDYAEKAARTRTDFDRIFRAGDHYIAAVDCDGKRHDHGLSFVNIYAVASGLTDGDKASQIFAWLDARSAEVYKYKFAPLSSLQTTRNAWRRRDANDYTRDAQLQDGGANFVVSGNDVVARSKVRGADDAFARLRSILQRYSEADKLTGGSPDIFGTTIQGGDHPGALGVLSFEFPESGLAGAAFLYAFVGVEPRWDGLVVIPRIPNALTSVSANNQ